jgi:hypothetical protein
MESVAPACNVAQWIVIEGVMGTASLSTFIDYRWVRMVLYQNAIPSALP